jgi:hypothetical protein
VSDWGGDGRNEDPQRGLVGLWGYAALLPMWGLVIWLASIDPTHPWRGLTTTLLSSYGALMLTFNAGAHWGMAPSVRAAAGATALVIIGLMAPLLPSNAAFVLLAIALAAQGAWDAFAVHREELPGWFGRLRTRMTFLAVTAMTLAFVATN